MFQTSTSIVSHHHKTSGKEADVSCLSSVTIATLVYRKQGFVALHAILVKKRISLPSLPHSITKDFFRYVKLLSVWKPSAISWWHLLQSTAHFVFVFIINSIIWHQLLFNFSHACQQHQRLDCPSYLPCRYCTWSSCSLRTHHETFDKGNTEKWMYVEHNFDVRGEYMTLVHQILTRLLLRPW